MKHSLLAIQILTRLSGHEQLRADLHSIIMAAREHQSHIDKHRFYSELVNTVLRANPEVPKGIWDYTNDPEEAEREWTEWTDGTVRDATHAAARAADPTLERFMFFTIAVLVERKSETDRALEKACNIPAERMWARKTFSQLYTAVTALDFRRVQSDAVFLSPGNLERGLTRADLESPTYAYFRNIML